MQVEGNIRAPVGSRGRGDVYQGERLSSRTERHANMVPGWCQACCFFQAEDGIRDPLGSRGLGDGYKRKGNIGYEFMHMGDPDEKNWIRDRIEGPGKKVIFTENGKKAILNKIIEAEGFEKYLHVKFVGTKRFGIDGGES